MIDVDVISSRSVSLSKLAVALVGLGVLAWRHTPDVVTTTLLEAALVLSLLSMTTLYLWLALETIRQVRGIDLEL